MKKLTALVLVLVFIFSLSGCKGARSNSNDMPDSDENKEFNIVKINSNIIMWTGEFSDEKFRDAIIEYQNNYSNVVFKNKEEASCVSFDVDFEVSSFSVSRLSQASDSDIEAELNGYIDLAIQTKLDNKTVTIYTDWWYMREDSWVNNYPVWSYLVCFKDTDNVMHNYYFRTDYSALITQSNNK